MGMDAGTGIRVDRQQPPVQVRPAQGRRLPLQPGTNPWGPPRAGTKAPAARRGNRAGCRRPGEAPGPAPRSWPFLAQGILPETGRGVGLGGFADVDEPMGRGGQDLRPWFGGAYVQAAIDLGRINADDIARKAGRQFHRQFCFARGGGTHEEDGEGAIGHDLEG